MFQNLNVLTFSNATDSAIKNENLSLISFDSLTVDFSYNTADYYGYGGAIYNENSITSFTNSIVSFSANTADYYGSGGAIYNNSSTASFANSTVSFSGNSAEQYGGAIYNNSSTVSFVNSTVSFLSNTAGYYGSGGAIYNYYSTASFVNSTVSFLSNTAESGGAIYNWDSTVSFVNSTVSFVANSANRFGGAIYNQSSTVSFVNSRGDFSGNTGEAIFNWEGTVSFDNSTVDFLGNTGGDIYNYRDATVSFTNSRVDFSGNTGRAISNQSYSTVSFTNSRVDFSSNTGGAIYNQGSTVSFVNSTVSFLDNTADYYYESGGAICNVDSFLTFDNSSATFLNNTATENGGAIYSGNHATASFINSIVDFSGNSGGSGGAIYSDNHATASFINSIVDFSGNSGGSGGAIHNWDYSTVSFVNSTVSFSSNSAREGGAIYNYWDSAVSFVNSTVSFVANTADYYGGAIFNYTSTVSFVNSTVSFLDNTASYHYGSGGAIYNEEAWLVFNNSSATFLNNTATGNGGIFYNFHSTVSFINSTVFFLNDRKPSNLDISNTDSLFVFTNSTATFFNNNSLTIGTGYRLISSRVIFDNSSATFFNNTAETGGGAIFNDANSTLIFKGGSKVVFEGNTAHYYGGADIYNNGFIEISERSEVILRSGINGGGEININSGGVLTISADEIFIGTLNVSDGGKFSLVDREAISKANGNNFRSSGFTGSAEPDSETLYSTKTAHIGYLIVDGILEIGVDLSSDNQNDLISANSITFLQGSFLNIVPFNEWSSPRTYSIISTYDLIGFENLDYDRSFFVLDYDEQMKTVSLKAIYPQTPEFIEAVFVANTIRQLSKFDDSSIYENANENYWGVAQIGTAELKNSYDWRFGANTTGVKAGAAVIKMKNLKAGVYAGYDFGETFQHTNKYDYDFEENSKKIDKAEFSAFQVGAYASLLTGNINFKALSAYQAITVKAKNDEFSTEFGINNINFGLSAELQTGKILTPYISLVGSSISSDEISQSSDYFNFDIDANSYFALSGKAGVQVKTKAKSVSLRAKGFLSYVLIGNDPEFDLTLTDNASKKTIASSANPNSEQPLFFGIEGGIDLPLTQQIALVTNVQINFNSDYGALQATVGVKYSFFGGSSERQGSGNERERKGTTGNDNGELPPAEQNGGQAATANDRETATTLSAGGQEEGTYVAIFDTNSSDLSQDALLVIINVVQNALRKQYTTIIVMGFAPDSANESANRTLSGLRAMAVARELQRYGIDRNKIKIEAYGSRNPRFPSATPASNAMNQRVEIVVVE